MVTTYLAIWLQDADPNGTRHLILIAIGLMAVAVAGISIIMLVIAVKAMKTMKELGSTAMEIKVKVMPLLDEVMAISKTSRILLEDAAPKVKIISENLVKTSETLVETSKVARGALQQIDATVTDANLRAQRQVARVDGMVTATLTTTAEVAEAIGNGIRVPAQKIAMMVTQAKVVAEGLLAKVKAMTANTPFGSRQRPE
jgi:uncharacterized protein YoxC